jgi:hypothetical protein
MRTPGTTSRDSEGTTPDKTAHERYSGEHLYDISDLTSLQLDGPPRHCYTYAIGSVEDLLERDAQREKDGFPRKIRIGRLSQMRAFRTDIQRQYASTPLTREMLLDGRTITETSMTSSLSDMSPSKVASYKRTNVQARRIV